MRQPIGQVTPEECRAIYRLHERLSSLRELLLSLDPEADAALVGRVEADQDATRARFDAWWADMAAKYSWPAGSYEINFESGQIYQLGTQTV